MFSMLYGAVAVLVPPTRGRRVALPAALVVAALVRWNWPFGGVPLASLAISQADAPLAQTARVFGSLTIVALVGVGGVALSALAERNYARHGHRCWRAGRSCVPQRLWRPTDKRSTPSTSRSCRVAGRRTPGQPTRARGRCSSATSKPAKACKARSTSCSGPRTSCTPGALSSTRTVYDETGRTGAGARCADHRWHRRDVWGRRASS